jgi:hypothetical protein
MLEALPITINVNGQDYRIGDILVEDDGTTTVAAGRGLPQLGEVYRDRDGELFMVADTRVSSLLGHELHLVSLHGATARDNRHALGHAAFEVADSFETLGAKIAEANAALGAGLGFYAPNPGSAFARLARESN